ncbi:hypothetical protein LXL04_011218 [Taraxacum kok-saghyz]
MESGAESAGKSCSCSCSRCAAFCSTPEKEGSPEGSSRTSEAGSGVEIGWRHFSIHDLGFDFCEFIELYLHFSYSDQEGMMAAYGQHLDFIVEYRGRSKSIMNFRKRYEITIYTRHRCELDIENLQSYCLEEESSTSSRNIFLHDIFSIDVFVSLSPDFITTDFSSTTSTGFHFHTHLQPVPVFFSTGFQRLHSLQVSSDFTSFPSRLLLYQFRTTSPSFHQRTAIPHSILAAIPTVQIRTATAPSSGVQIHPSEQRFPATSRNSASPAFHPSEQRFPTGCILAISWKCGHHKLKRDKAYKMATPPLHVAVGDNIVQIIKAVLNLFLKNMNTPVEKFQTIFGSRWRRLLRERDFCEHVGGIDRKNLF